MSPTPTPATPAQHEPDAARDLVGIGIGPFNLSLAALAHPLTELDTAFYDQRPAFDWHPGLLIDGATLQVPFLADLVTLADPASRWSFLTYLRAHDRLFPFYFAERFHIQRAEYAAYCHWVSENLHGLHFGHHIDAIHWNPERDLFEIDFTRLDSQDHPAIHSASHPEGHARCTAPIRAGASLGRTYSKNIVLGIGTAPHIPDPLRSLVETPGTPVIHAADYLEHRERLLTAEHITVIGSGQSGAEVYLDLLRHRPTGREKIHWLTRTEAFAPMEYSKLGLEHFTPDYTRYFHALAEPVRDRLVPAQWQLHKGIDADTIAAIHDELYRRTLHGGWPDTVLTPGVHVHAAARAVPTGIELQLEHAQQGTRSCLTTDAVILATGYRQRSLGQLLAGLDPYMRRDTAERPHIDDQYRLTLDPTVTGSLYVQNAELHTHGIGTPDLGLAAWRSATILNSLTGKNPYPLPRRTAFTTFGLQQQPQNPGTGQRNHMRERPHASI